MQIQIGDAGLSAIYAAKLAVTLARQFAQVVDAASQTIVAWQAFAPLQQNTVTWDDHFYCFATTTPLALGQVIAMNARSELPMQIGVVYEFAQGQFGYGQKAQNAAAYVIANNTPGTIYGFGLAQSAVVNNVTTLAPFCAAPVLYNQAIYFTPADVVAVFLSSASTGGTILPPPFNPLDVSAGGGAAEPIVGFNDQTNTFFVLSQEEPS